MLVRGYVRKGDAEAALAGAAHVAEGDFETSFVEHAYIEPEAGFARRVGDGVEVHVTTQTPYMDRDEVAPILGLAPEQVRIVPTACGGGFGGKLDMSLQPLRRARRLAARPAGALPLQPGGIDGHDHQAASGADARAHRRRCRGPAGRRCDFDGDFNTGAYASWGPTVANRVPVHCSGPYFVPAIEARSRAVLTNLVPAGAFRGFGTPQAAIATEALLDELADRLGIDRLEFRLINALRAGQPTATGQVLEASVGMAACLEALRPAWRAGRAAAPAHNAGDRRPAPGAASASPACGTAAATPRSPTRRRCASRCKARRHAGALPGRRRHRPGLEHRAGADLRRDARRAARPADAGDRRYRRAPAMPARPRPRGRPSSPAGRRSGRREALRAAILRLAERRRRRRHRPRRRARHASATARRSRRIDLAALPADAEGDVLAGEATFDPPTTPLDENGQGIPYATYAFGAQVAEVLVDVELGTVKVLRVTAAHDVGQAINPMLIEGQVEGGIAQGIGMALMEEWVPGRTDNLHDYLIPTVGDVPEIETILIEDPEPLGPVRRQGRRRAGADPDGGGHPQRHPRRHRRHHPPGAGDARPGARGDPGGAGETPA